MDTEKCGMKTEISMLAIGRKISQVETAFFFLVIYLLNPNSQILQNFVIQAHSRRASFMELAKPLLQHPLKKANSFISVTGKMEKEKALGNNFIMKVTDFFTLDNGQMI